MATTPIKPITKVTPVEPIFKPTPKVDVAIVASMQQVKAAVEQLNPPVTPKPVPDVLKQIKTWFETAIPEPTPATQNKQLGCHLEEFVETLSETTVHGFLSLQDDSERLLTALADVLKTQKNVNTTIVDDVKFLDGLADQIVTAIGVAHSHGYDILGALQEVANSNDSKFVDGKAVFDENGKIAKGPNYFVADLKKFV